jgi:lauroyl/myristoyl acyltransferase
MPRDPREEGLRLKVSALVWHVVWEVVRMLPERAAFGLAAAAALPFRLVAATQRRQVRANLARVSPEASEVELDRQVVEAFRSYSRYYVESFRAADIPADVIRRRVTTEGFAHLDGVLDRGRGAIVLLAHHGSWDIAARWAEIHGYHLAVVAEVVRPRTLFEKFVRLRESVGLEVVPLRRGDDLAGRLAAVLEANHLVGLLSDRDLTSRAPIVSLFGEPSRVPYGPVVLSRRTGAGVVPISMLQLPGRRWHIRALPEIDVSQASIEDGCQAVAAGIEAIVRTDPPQWHAFSPVWLADLPPHRRGDVPEGLIDGADGPR